MRALALLALIGCKETEPEIVAPQPAPLVEPTGACPAITEPGIVSFTSNGIERRFDIRFPKNKPAGMPIVFIWHGLAPPEYDPMGSFVSAFDTDDLARTRDAIVVTPEAMPFNLAGFPVLLWGFLDNDEDDLALYDDLRTCLIRSFDADVNRVYSWGFSGGGLWSSYLMIHRADTLAAAGSASGGSDIRVLSAPYIEYQTPAQPVPALLGAGGANDKWPDPALVIIDFEEATDNLQAGLVADDSAVVRCHHDTGHNVPEWMWGQTKKFLFAHTYGQASPYAADADLVDGCEIAGP
ncbi:MAG TPA: hypothetical protein PKA64_05575 [Myxococcota bacterium]|nr:hypothetical protein [Myxococcota bacterium]